MTLIRGVVSSPVRGVVGSGFGGGIGPEGDAYFYADFRYPTQYFYLDGVAYQQFTDIPGSSSVGGAGFGMVQRNGIWTPVPADAPLIGDGGLRNAEERTEVATWSNDLTNAAWVTTNLSRTLVPGPGGAGQATRLQVLSIGVATIAIRGFSSWAATQACTHQIVKLGAASSVTFVLRNSSTSTILCQGDLNSGGVTFSGTYAAKCKATALPDGWWLIELYADGGITIGDTLQTYQGWSGSVVSTGGNIDIYTSGIRAAPPISDPPIITQGLPATRTAVAQSVGGLVLPSALTVLATINTERAVSGASNEYVFALSDGTLNNRITIFRPLASGNIDARVVSSGVAASPAAQAGAFGAGRRTVGIAVEAGRAALAIGGNAPTTSTPAGVPALATTLSVGLGENLASSWFNGLVERITILPRALSNAELQAATAP